MPTTPTERRDGDVLHSVASVDKAVARPGFGPLVRISAVSRRRCRGTSRKRCPSSPPAVPREATLIEDLDATQRPDPADVGRLARRGAVWSALQIVARHVVSVGSTAAMARLISPDDYGLVGMVTTLTALLLVFSDMGLSWATIQRRELTGAQVANLFWLNTAAGAVLWLLCVGLAPGVAAFYHRAELRDVTVVLGAMFVLGGIAAQPFALLARRMQFRLAAAIEVSSLLVSVATGIGLALQGMGYWALVAQAVAGQTVRVALVLCTTGFDVRRPRWNVGTLGLVGFGSLMALNGLLIYFARNLDNVLIGRYWGTIELGYYSRAYFLMLLPSMLATGVLTQLMVPTLAVFQGDKARFGSAYRRAVRLVAFVGCPLAAGLALTAPEAVRLVYGERWAPVAPMLQWLSIAGITQPIYNTTGWLFTAAGQGRLYFVVTVMNCAALVATFFWTAAHGAVAVATGYGLMMGLVLVGPALFLAHRAARIRLAETLRSLRPVLVAVGLMAAAGFAAGSVASSIGLAWQLVLASKSVAALAAYVLASRYLLGEMLVNDVFSMLPPAMARRATRVVGAVA
jgi:O-antigen/teichoic acid export membrane protein